MTISTVIISRATGYDLEPTRLSIKNQSVKSEQVLHLRDEDDEGQSVVRNRGAKKAIGEFIVFSDDDIKWEPKAFEMMRDALLKDPGASFAYCDYLRTGHLFGVHKGQRWDAEALKEGNYISTMSMIRYKDFPGFDDKLRRYEDWDLWLTMAASGKRGVYVPEILFTARYDKGDISMTRGTDDAFWIDTVRRKHNIWNVDLSIIRNGPPPVFDNEFHDCTFGNYEYLVNLKSINDEIKRSHGKHITIIGPDTIFTKGWNCRLLNTLYKIPKCSACGPMTAHVGSYQRIDLMTKYSKYVNRHNIHQAVADLNYNECVTGGKICSHCFMFSRKMYNAIGEFDETYKTFEATLQDWILRGMAKGFAPHINTGSYVHNFGVVHKRDQDALWNEDHPRLQEKHGDKLFNILEYDWNEKLIAMNPQRK